MRSAAPAPPKTSRRKGDGTDEAARDLFPRAWRLAAARTRPAAYAAGIFMSEMLDWAHVWHHHDSPGASGQDPDNGFTAGSNHLSPKP